jgi:hypothetical protein
MELENLERVPQPEYVEYSNDEEVVKEGGDGSKENINRKKRGNFLLRQELKSYTPECNPTCGIIFNISIMFVFLALGIPIILFSEQIVEIKKDYTKWYNLFI